MLSLAHKQRKGRILKAHKVGILKPAVSFCSLFEAVTWISVHASLWSVEIRSSDDIAAIVNVSNCR